jgi:hypothetical protein
MAKAIGKMGKRLDFLLPFLLTFLHFRVAIFEMMPAE